MSPQQLPLAEFFIYSNDPLDRQASLSAHCNAGSASPPQPLTLPRFAVPAAPAAPATVMLALRLHACHHRHRVSRSMPTCAPHMVYRLKPHRCDLVCVHPSQSRPTATCQNHPSGNISCALSYYLQKECKSPPQRETHSAMCADPRAGRGSIPEAPVCCPAHGKIRTAQICWTRPPSQCRQRSHASSISSLYSAMESESSAQEPHQYHRSGLWKVPCGYSSRS